MTSRATETYAKKNAKSGRKNISIRLNEGKNRLVLKILNRVRFCTSSYVIYLKYFFFLSSCSYTSSLFSNQNVQCGLQIQKSPNIQNYRIQFQKQ